MVLEVWGRVTLWKNIGLDHDFGPETMKTSCCCKLQSNRFEMERSATQNAFFVQHQYAHYFLLLLYIQQNHQNAAPQMSDVLQRQDQLAEVGH